jgi:electron transfer flavoprotein alpha/beta subunit
MPGRIVIAILLPCALTAQDRIEAPRAADLAKQIAELNAVIEKLERRVDELDPSQRPPSKRRRRNQMS